MINLKTVYFPYSVILATEGWEWELDLSKFGISSADTQELQGQITNKWFLSWFFVGNNVNGVLISKEAKVVANESEGTWTISNPYSEWDDIAPWPEGSYLCYGVLQIAGGGVKYYTGRNTISVGPGYDFDVNTNSYETRTPNRIAYDNINLVLQGRATSDTYSYQIGGRSLQKMSVADLIALRSHFSKLVAQELGIFRDTTPIYYNFNGNL